MIIFTKQFGVFVSYSEKCQWKRFLSSVWLGMGFPSDSSEYPHPEPTFVRLFQRKMGVFVFSAHVNNAYIPLFFVLVVYRAIGIFGLNKVYTNQTKRQDTDDHWRGSGQVFSRMMLMGRLAGHQHISWTKDWPTEGLITARVAALWFAQMKPKGYHRHRCTTFDSSSSSTSKGSNCYASNSICNSSSNNNCNNINISITVIGNRSSSNILQ